LEFVLIYLKRWIYLREQSGFLYCYTHRLV